MIEYIDKEESTGLFREFSYNNLKEIIMKYIVILMIFLSLSEAKDINKFVKLLETSSQNNKDIVLSLDDKYVDNNIKYLVVPNINMYAKNYKDFFSSTYLIDDKVINRVFGKPPIFEVFLHNLNLLIYDYNYRTNLTTESMNKIHALELIQYNVLSDMINISKTEYQLKFSTHYMHMLFGSFDVTNKKYCNIIEKHKNGTIYKFVTILEEKYLKNPFTDINVSNKEKIKRFPLIIKKDLTNKNIQLIYEKSYVIVKNENTIFLNKIKNSSDVDFSFLKNYIKELENRERELNNQKEKLQKNKASLLDLQIFYSSYYSNIINLSSAKLFKDLLFIYNYEKSLKKECISK